MQYGAWDTRVGAPQDQKGVSEKNYNNCESFFTPSNVADVILSHTNVIFCYFHNAGAGVMQHSFWQFILLFQTPTYTLSAQKKWFVNERLSKCYTQQWKILKMAFFTWDIWMKVSGNVARSFQKLCVNFPNKKVEKNWMS